MKYYIVEESFFSSDIGEYKAYGIELRDKRRVLKKISDIDTRRQKVEKLCTLCNKLKLSEVHFEDVIDDYLSEY